MYNKQVVKQIIQKTRQLSVVSVGSAVILRMVIAKSEMDDGRAREYVGIS